MLLCVFWLHFANDFFFLHTQLPSKRKMRPKMKATRSHCWKWGDKSTSTKGKRRSMRFYKWNVSLHKSRCCKGTKLLSHHLLLCAFTSTVRSCLKTCRRLVNKERVKVKADWDFSWFSSNFCSTVVKILLLSLFWGGYSRRSWEEEGRWALCCCIV